MQEKIIPCNNIFINKRILFKICLPLHFGSNIDTLCTSEYTSEVNLVF